MNKSILVSFLLVASLLLLATATVSATTSDVTDLVVKVDGVVVDCSTTPAIDAGETVSIKVVFTAPSDLGSDGSASDVRIKATLEGDSDDVSTATSKFNVEEDKTYVKYLTLKVPADFDDDDYSDELNLNIKISSDDDEVTADEDYAISVQRVPYNVAIKSVSVDSSVYAGEKLPVEIVLKNVGYNELDDVYVRVSIPELNVEKSTYLGDIVTEPYEDSSDNDDDEKSTVSGTLYLEVPYTAGGVYTLVVSAENDELEDTYERQITVENSVSDVAIKSGNDLILLNPTNKLVVYTVKYLSNEVPVVVSAGSSKSVSIEVPTGDYDFDVVVYSGDSVVDSVNFNGSAQESEVQLTNPVFVLTVILAVVFLVLLVVLVVLITKKPQKTEEFGESYY